MHIVDDPSDYAHIGPGTLAGRYLRRFWQPVSRSSDLEMGRPKRLHILGDFFTLYRGESGAAIVIDDRCPHRQTSLSLGWIEGDCIRCLYHGWAFDKTGQCIEQPAEQAAFAAKVRVKSYPTYEYFGLLFAYFGEGDPPTRPRFIELETVVGANYSVNAHEVPCNYFQRIENDLDEVHIHYVHSVSTRQVGLVELPDITVIETAYGIRREGKRSNGGVNVSRTGHFMMPNINMTDLSPSPEFPYWTVHVAYRVPIDDETSMTFSIRLKKPLAEAESHSGQFEDRVQGGGNGPTPLELSEKILAGEMRLQDVDPNYPGLFTVEDNVTLAGQGRITNRAADHLGQSDKGIILLRKIWLRELYALSEGKPMKEWVRPGTCLDLAVTKISETADVIAANV